MEKDGHEVSTIAEENLNGAEGRILAAICQREKLCRITADLDFAQTILYPPGDFHGLVVLRHPKPTVSGMRELVRQFVVALHHESPVERLWIVEPGRLRIHGLPNDE